MKPKNYQQMVREAKEAVHDLEEPFKSIAFREVLNDLMRESSEPQRGAKQERIPSPKRVDLTGGFLESHGIQTLNQLVNILSPKSHVDEVLVMAYYLKQTKGLKVFQTKDIESCYREALMKPSTNTTQMVNENKRKGFIMDMTDESGAVGKSITIRGIKEMEDRISRALAKKDE